MERPKGFAKVEEGNPRVVEIWDDSKDRPRIVRALIYQDEKCVDSEARSIERVMSLIEDGIDSVIIETREPSEEDAIKMAKELIEKELGEEIAERYKLRIDWINFSEAIPAEKQKAEDNAIEIVCLKSVREDTKLDSALTRARFDSVQKIHEASPEDLIRDVALTITSALSLKQEALMLMKEHKTECLDRLSDVAMVTAEVAEILYKDGIETWSSLARHPTDYIAEILDCSEQMAQGIIDGAENLRVDKE